MKFAKFGNKYAEFGGIDPFLAEIIKQIPDAAEPEGSMAAIERLFSSPSINDHNLRKDWQDYVIPDLKIQFGSAMEVVRSDLEKYFVETKNNADFPWRLRVPLIHLDVWLNALNQARLVLAARYNFSDEELSLGFKPQLTSVRDLALYQIAIYGWMQELLLTVM